MEILGQPVAKLRPLRGTPLLVVAGSIAILALALHVGIAFWAQNEFTQPEGIVATQTFSLAQEGNLYYDLKHYPYTVCAYMPSFYILAAGLNRIGLPVLLAGRVLSLAALAAILMLIWRILILYTGDRHCAATGVALAGLTQLLLGWGITGQVDMLAVALTLAAFHEYVRYRVTGADSLDWAAIFAIAGLFTKQTVLAAPAAIFLMLLIESPKRAGRFAMIAAGVGGAAVLGLNALMNGRFLDNTVFANLNPFALYKLNVHFEYMAVALMPLLPVAVLGARRSFRTPMRAAFIYLGFAFAVLMLTAAKVGSDSNYQIETAILLILCACLSLHALDFFPLYLSGSKKWVTLLILPLGLYALQNIRVAATGVLQRIAREQSFRTQVAALNPYLAGSGPILSTDSNALVHAKRRFEVEPLIYRLLVEAGRIDARPVLADLDRARFQTILLYENLAANPDTDPEFPRLTAAQSDSVRKHYRMVKHLPGPYLDGVYVYQPMPGWGR